MIAKLNDTYKAYLMLLMTSFGWASSTIIIKVFITDIKAYHMMFGRFLIAFLLIWAIHPKKMVRLSKRDMTIAFALGILIFASYAFGIISLVYTTASKSGFLVAMSVLLVPISQLLVRRKRPNGIIVGTVCLSLIGLYFVSGMDGVGFNFGDLLALLCAATYTGYILIVDRYVKEIDGVTLVLYQMLGVTILSLFLAIGVEGFDIGILKSGFIPIFFTGILGTAMTIYFQNHAQKHASPESVGLLLLGEPVFTLLMAFFILQETITRSGLIGAGFIISAMLITILKKV